MVNNKDDDDGYIDRTSMTTADDIQQEQQQQHHDDGDDDEKTKGESTSNNSGIWIGIDLGTSNSACAVWDSSRGGSKWYVQIQKVIISLFSFYCDVLLSSSLRSDQNQTRPDPIRPDHMCFTVY
jgi:hypothetical protein